jgi:hypothetical protein
MVLLCQQHGTDKTGIGNFASSWDIVKRNEKDSFITNNCIGICTIFGVKSSAPESQLQIR